MAGNVFRLFQPGGPKEDRTQKRRAQLRQAQQTYRDRKGRYTRCLEKEIARARESEASLLIELQRLTGIVDTLAQSLHKNGVYSAEDLRGLVENHHALVGESPSTIASSPKLQQIRARSRSKGVEGLSASNADTADQDLKAGPDFHFSSREADSYRDLRERPLPQIPPREYIEHTHAQLTLPRPGVRMCDLDLTQAGMGFVLTLERPCLGHIHGSPDQPDEPTGHALTASAYLLAVSPQYLPSPDNPRKDLDRDVSATVLDSLLNLSAELCSEREVTPVQAWNQIQLQPKFESLDLLSLHKFAENLRDAVKCHGFGAVIERTVFENLAARVLGARLF